MSIESICTVRDILGSEIKNKNKNTECKKQNVDQYKIDQLSEDIFRDITYNPIFHTIKETDSLTTPTNQNLYCFVCQVEYFGKYMEKHEMIHGKTTLKCENCSKIYENPKDIKHFLNHRCALRNECKILTCDVCNRTFNRTQSFTNHKKIHKGMI